MVAAYGTTPTAGGVGVGGDGKGGGGDGSGGDGEGEGGGGNSVGEGGASLMKTASPPFVVLTEYPKPGSRVLSVPYQP